MNTREIYEKRQTGAKFFTGVFDVKLKKIVPCKEHVVIGFGHDEHYPYLIDENNNKHYTHKVYAIGEI